MFRFRLETVLRLQEKEAETIRIQLAEILSQKQRIYAEIHHYQHQLQSVTESYTPLSLPSIHALEARWHYIRRIEYHIQALEVRLQKITMQELEMRNRLTAVLQKQRAYERLKERQYQQYLQDKQRAEQKQLDDIAQQRHNHRNQTKQQ